MAMSVPSDDDDGEVLCEMNTTPLIDVMLVLLIMLIITIPIQTHAVKLNMPANTSSAASEPPKVVQIAIAADGTVRWDGESVGDPQRPRSQDYGCGAPKPAAGNPRAGRRLGTVRSRSHGHGLVAAARVDEDRRHRQRSISLNASCPPLSGRGGAGVDRQLRRKRPLISRPRFAARHVGG